MSEHCLAVHQRVCALPRHFFPFAQNQIPADGIYLLFEQGEHGHGGSRIVRIGTHTGARQLRSRLQQHFLNENKDRSIFRKNIGRAILHRSGDPFLSDWNLDLTTRKARSLHAHRVDRAKQRIVEAEVSAYIREHFQFVVISVPDRSRRLLWEARLISTISRCEHCKASDSWLGNFSPVPKIVESGLWQVNELYKEEFAPGELAEFNQAVAIYTQKKTSP